MKWFVGKTIARMAELMGITPLKAAVLESIFAMPLIVKGVK